jgi:serine/threonine-protein kinase RsbW
MEQMGISKEEHGVQTAVGEACTNVMKYAYSEKGGLITLTCEMKDHSFVVVISDHGKPFDPGSIPPPDLDASLEKRRIGGLGMYLMKKYMDEVTYSFKADTGNTLVMKKMLTGKQGP